MKIVKNLVGAIGLIIVALPITSLSDESIEAREVISDVGALYHGLSSYSDAGKVTGFYKSGDVTQIEFETKFKRNTGLILRAKIHENRGGISDYVVWGDEKKGRFYRKIHGQETLDNIDDMKHALNEIGRMLSSGIVTAPNLLLYEKLYSRSNYPHSRGLSGYAGRMYGVSKDNPAYITITMSHDNGHINKYWIDSATLFIKRIEIQLPANLLGVRYEVSFDEIMINPPIDDSEFTFEPMLAQRIFGPILRPFIKLYYVIAAAIGGGH